MIIASVSVNTCSLESQSLYLRDAQYRFICQSEVSLTNYNFGRLWELKLELIHLHLIVHRGNIIHISGRLRRSNDSISGRRQTFNYIVNAK